jgi:hypothetical protein
MHPLPLRILLCLFKDLISREFECNKAVCCDKSHWVAENIYIPILATDGHYQWYCNATFTVTTREYCNNMAICTDMKRPKSWGTFASRNERGGEAEEKNTELQTWRRRSSLTEFQTPLECVCVLSASESKFDGLGLGWGYLDLAEISSRYYGNLWMAL